MAFVETINVPSGSYIATNLSYQYGNAFTNGVGLQRAYGVSLGYSVSVALVTLPVIEPDTNYMVQVEPNYSSATYVSTKSTSAFMVNFASVTANSTSSFDWLLVR
jgi:hypothetical protein